MCAVNGIFAYHYAANPVDRAELVATRDHMQARGPDGSGLWIDPDERIGLGHRRLAIIDLSEAGAQPMVSADGRFIVTFNGEIYNYQALRRDLEGQGCVFASRSDTEVLLHLYARRGADMVHDLRGMFAFAIHDQLRGELFLARDPYGIKPLYYADDGWTFRFASQVKALVAGGAVSRARDPAGQVGFYLFGHVPDPFTIYRAVRALPAGTRMLVDSRGASSPKRYHSVAQVYCDAEAGGRGRLDAAGVQAEFRTAALDSVRQHLVADVPVGAFLSAGVDSASLVGLMRDAGQQDIQAVTLSFSEFEGTAEDEGPFAAQVAQTYGARHTIRRVDRAEFEADLPRILDAMDQPTIDAVNTWFVSKATRELGLKVAISGLGGDELLGGYPSFRAIPTWVRWMRGPACLPFLGGIGRRLGRPLGAALNLSPKAVGMLEYGGSYPGAYLLKRALFMPWELETVLPAEVVREGLARLAPLALIAGEITPQPAAPIARVAALESGLYMRSRLLRDADWASMAHSVELRMPLVDATLLQRTAALAAASGIQPGKAMLAAAPQKPLPSAVRQRPKTGFMTPLASWQDRPYLALEGAPGQTSGEPWARRWGRAVMREFN
jgi:asparagine synthase (glutamine-hydrolysing)